MIEVIQTGAMLCVTINGTPVFIPESDGKVLRVLLNTHFGDEPASPARLAPDAPSEAMQQLPDVEPVKHDG